MWRLMIAILLGFFTMPYQGQADPDAKVFDMMLSPDAILPVEADTIISPLPSQPPRSTYTRRLSRKRSLGHPQTEFKAPEAQWFTQSLDHFQPTDLRTWKQRFWVNDTFYKPGGPAFLMIGGEGEASSKWLVEGTWIDYARAFGAICFQLEHRFYGHSRPTPDMSVKNLQYLSSEQALADLASFVTDMNGRYNLTEAKWISFGGSYPGSLSAWFRLKYPHLVHGAVSTSGPLLAKADFFEYLEVVSDALDVTNKGCNPAIKDALAKVEMLTMHRVGWKMISKTFNLCQPFNGQNAADLSNLFEALIGNFEDIVQYNKDNRAFEGSTNDNVTIDTLCDIMTEGSKLFGKVDKRKGASAASRFFFTPLHESPSDHRITSELNNFLSNMEDNAEHAFNDLGVDTNEIPKKLSAVANLAKGVGSTIMNVFKAKTSYEESNQHDQLLRTNAIPTSGDTKSTLQRLAAVNDFVLKMNGERCLDISYESMVDELKQTKWPRGGGVGARQWTYQTCTEFGWYQSSDQPGHPYTDHFGIDFQERICSDVYGSKFNKELLERAIKRSNTMYGAKDIKVSNVVFVHGSIDPWHAMGITQDLSPDATAVYIEGTAHCANMYPEREEDLPQLKKARRTVKNKIAQWLKK